jgi:hypothetical protein
MKPATLKRVLQKAIEAVDQMPEDQDIELEPNTVGMNGDYLYIDGFRDRGFVNLENLG